MANGDKHDYVAHMYPGPDWKKRVDKMSDEQIFAIYMRDLRKKEAELAAKKAANKAPIHDDIPF